MGRYICMHIHMYIIMTCSTYTISTIESVPLKVAVVQVSVLLQFAHTTISYALIAQYYNKSTVLFMNCQYRSALRHKQ